MNPESIVDKVKQHRPSILGNKEFLKFAILLPLIQKDDAIHVLFEVRSHHMRRQPGEICFPGGKIDREDPSARAAAIRETREELGIDEANLTDVHPLDFLMSPFGMIVYPFSGFVQQSESSIKRNPAEVSEVFTVPLSFFIENKPRIHHVNFNATPEADFPFDLIPGGKEYNWRTRQLEEYFYIYEDKVIWGMTAKILAHFIEMIR